VQALGGIASRETQLDQDKGGLITVTSVHAGHATNVIPSEAFIAGTFRSMSPTVMDTLRRRIREAASHIAASFRCRADVEFLTDSYPPTRNDPGLWNSFHQLITSDSSPFRGAVETAEVTMGAEDFSFVAERVPSLFIQLGSGSGAEVPSHVATNFSAHHDQFAVDERALPIGAALHYLFAVNSLKELQQQDESNLKEPTDEAAPMPIQF